MHTINEQDGKENNQGVAYLEDGTMVVVNGGGEFLSETIRTQVLSQKYSSSGKIIFCITPSPNIWGEDVNETSSFLPMVAQRMIQIMPRLKNIRVRRTWRGLYPMTPDGFPIVGWSSEVSNLLLGVGLCGQGFMLGPALGELLTRMVGGNLLAEDAETLSYMSPQREFQGQEILK